MFRGLISFDLLCADDLPAANFFNRYLSN